MKQLIFIAIVFLSLISCSQKEQRLVLKTKTVFGLSDASVVIFNSSKIGRIQVVPHQDYVDVVLVDATGNLPPIPVDSKLRIMDSSTFKNMKIALVPGQSHRYCKPGDTLGWFVSPSEKELEKNLMIGDSLLVTNKKT